MIRLKIILNMLNISNITYDELMRIKKTEDGKKKRDYGKFANLSFQYRIGGKAASEKALKDYGIIMSVDDGKLVKQQYEEYYYSVPEWWDTIIQQSEIQGYSETKGHRRVKQVDWTGRNEWYNGQTAINFPIQGTAGDQKYMANWATCKFCIKHKIRLLFDLHDGLWYILPKSEAKDLLIEMRTTMSNLPYDMFGWEPRISFPVSASVGYSVGSMEELN